MPKPSNRNADSITDLLSRIDEAPDDLHNDMTPAVHQLADMGWQAAPGLLDLMTSDSTDTRLHAQRALEGILARDLGFVPGQGFTLAAGEDRFRAIWSRNSSYAYDAAPELRAKAVSTWRQWLLSSHQKGAS